MEMLRVNGPCRKIAYCRHLIVSVDGLKDQSDDVKHGGGIEMLLRTMRLRRKEGYGKSGSKEVVKNRILQQSGEQSQ